MTPQIQTTGFLPNIVLDASNYPSWVFRLESFLKGQNLFGFVDGSIACPPQFVQSSDGTTIISAEYIDWTAQDHRIINMISETLGPVAMSCAVGSSSSQAMWTTLRLRFASPDRHNVLRLKSNLQALKKGSDNIETFFDKIKVATDALATVGVFLDAEDIVDIILRGLPTEFVAIKAVIRAQFVCGSMPDIKALLKAAELDIENEKQASTVYSQTPIVSSQSNSPSVPPGFSPFASPTAHPLALVSRVFPYTLVPTVPLSFVHSNPFSMDSPFIMAGFSGGSDRGVGFSPDRNALFGGGNGNGGFNSQNIGNNYGNGNGNGVFPNYGGFTDGNGTRNNADNLTCQLCDMVGHGANTCRFLSNFQQNHNFFTGGMKCQYCGRKNHTADRCYNLFGFPGHHQQHSSPSHAVVAMLASANSTPQFFCFANSGATTHMSTIPHSSSPSRSFTLNKSVPAFSYGNIMNVTAQQTTPTQPSDENYTSHSGNVSSTALNSTPGPLDVDLTQAVPSSLPAFPQSSSPYSTTQTRTNDDESTTIFAPIVCSDEGVSTVINRGDNQRHQLSASNIFHYVDGLIVPAWKSNLQQDAYIALFQQQNWTLDIALFRLLLMDLFNFNLLHLHSYLCRCSPQHSSLCSSLMVRSSHPAEEGC